MEIVLKHENDKAFLCKETYPNMELLEKCVCEVDPLLVEKPMIFIHGTPKKQQRYVRFYSSFSKGYRYSGTVAKAHQLTDNMQLLLDDVNKLYDASFNGLLINKYENGDDYIGPHSDSTTGINPDKIMSISFGAERTFRIRDKQTQKIMLDCPVNNGTVLCMCGEFQKYYTHEIPKTKKIKDARISITFRQHIVKDDHLTTIHQI